MDEILISQVITVPYHFAPYDLKAWPTSVANKSIQEMGNAVIAPDNISRVGSTALTVWTIMFDNPFFVAFFVLLASVGVIFWMAHWLLDRKRSRYNMDWSAGVKSATDNVSTLHDAITSPQEYERYLHESHQNFDPKRPYSSGQQIYSNRPWRRK